MLMYGVRSLWLSFWSLELNMFFVYSWDLNLGFQDYLCLSAPPGPYFQWLVCQLRGHTWSFPLGQSDAPTYIGRFLTCAPPAHGLSRGRLSQGKVDLGLPPSWFSLTDPSPHLLRFCVKFCLVPEFMN